MSIQQVEAVEVASESIESGSRASEVWYRVRHNPSAIFGMAMIALFVLVALLAPLIAPHAPNDNQWFDEILPGQVPGPRAENLLGTDTLGRDELSRLVYGARYSLVIGVVSMAMGASAGLLIGGLAGAFGGWVDNVLMRLMDIMLSVPGLLLAIGVAALLGRSLFTVMLAVAVVNVPAFARLLRGSMLAQREADYVVAARSIGLKRSRIVLRHVIPNSVAPVIVQGTLALATAIVDAAGLAFLGLGSEDPGIPEWGRMLAENQNVLATAPQLVLFPGLAILVSVLGFNLLGEALREALDPKLRR